MCPPPCSFAPARRLSGPASTISGAIGLDTASIHYGQSSLFESHRVLYARDIPAFENLASLDKLPVKEFVVMGLPMKIRRGSGGPLRAIAIVPEAR